MVEQKQFQESMTIDENLDTLDYLSDVSGTIIGQDLYQNTLTEAGNQKGNVNFGYQYNYQGANLNVDEYAEHLGRS